MIAAVPVVTGSTPTKLSDPFTKFFHVQNKGTVSLFVKFDSSDTALTVANGIEVPVGETLYLENISLQNRLYESPVYAVHADGSSQEARVQSV